MQIEIGSIFYEIVLWNKDYIQILGSSSPYRVYAPAHCDVAFLKEYIKLNPPESKSEDSSYSYLEDPYYLFGKPYLVKIYTSAMLPTVELTATSICVYQKKNTNTLNLLYKWCQELLFHEVVKQIAYWEEQLDIYDVATVTIRKLPKSDFRIVEGGFQFSNRLIDFKKEHINLIILKAFCKFADKTRKETEAIFNLYIPNWRDLY
ncbi:hypothetical protein AAW12_09950 [Sphingobacterium sp. Ag1]|uniref:hypothetical protein n=1 Tax=Sphingobacterium sp. Ag1 TaxID=1643451 RepID=UPI000627DC28|nr:hypothetical protein [Sphingobacterium sp. Ag1]KKO91391.1 hypothetical protein AAW12_09950 [Sphingobacterium sp. Ag1]